MSSPQGYFLRGLTLGAIELAVHPLLFAVREKLGEGERETVQVNLFSVIRSNYVHICHVLKKLHEQKKKNQSKFKNIKILFESGSEIKVEI